MNDTELIRTLRDALMDTPIQPRPLKYTLQDFYDAVSGIGPRAYDWSDKPHRLLYDLIAGIAYERAHGTQQDAEYFRWLVNNARIAFSESGEVTLKFTLSSDSFLGLRDAVRQAMKGE